MKCYEVCYNIYGLLLTKREVKMAGYWPTKREKIASDSQIRFILPARGASHIIKSVMKNNQSTYLQMQVMYHFSQHKQPTVLFWD